MFEPARRLAAPILVVAILAASLSLTVPPASALAPPGPIVVVDLGRSGETRGALANAGIPECPPGGGFDCFVLISHADLLAEPFIGRKVLLVPTVRGSGLTQELALRALAMRQEDIETWIKNGGVLIALADARTAPTTLPYGFAPKPPAVVVTGGGVDVQLTVAGAAHPVYAGQSSASLSGIVLAYHNGFDPATLPPYANEVLLETVEFAPLVGARPITITGAHGKGCVLLSGADPDNHGSNVYNHGAQASFTVLRQMILWGVGCGPSPKTCECPEMLHSTIHYGEDFELDSGGWTVSGTQAWQYGTPTAPPSPKPGNGPAMWGTRLAGPVHTRECSAVTSPFMTLPSAPGGTLVAARVSFHLWKDLSPHRDGGLLQVSRDGGASWDTIAPYGGYDGAVGAPARDCLALGPSDPAWTGVEIAGWHCVEADLTAYLGETIQLRILYAGAQSGHRGLYVDNVVVEFGLGARTIDPPGGLIADS